MLQSSKVFNYQYKGFVLLLVLFCSSIADALFEGCDVTKYLNSSIYLESPYFSNYYEQGTSCRYTFIAPPDNVIEVQCFVDIFKYKEQCSSEFLYISYDGDKGLRGSEQICGNGNINRVSNFRSIVFAYVSQYLTQEQQIKTHTGRFRCLLSLKQQTPDCGWSMSPRIVNGNEASLHEFPSAAAIRDLSTLDLICGGTIIAHYFILTAAHCAKNRNPLEIIAHLGKHDITVTADQLYEVKHRIAQIFIHPNYVEKESVLLNDLAILRTYNYIEWSRGVGPACLPFQNRNDDFAYRYVDVLGWGTKSFGGKFSNSLQKVSLMVAKYANCKEQFSDADPRAHLCTYDSYGLKQDSCQFDSGGPVILKNSGQFLVGCISFGPICGIKYGMALNTRVSTYLDWIVRTTGSMNNFVEKKMT